MKLLSFSLFFFFSSLCSLTFDHYLHTYLHAYCTFCFSLYTIYIHTSMHTVLTTTTTVTPSSFAVRQWRRFSSQVRSMHLKRQKSTSSRKSEASSKSSKSVRFELVEDVYYTHSPSEYDRSPATENTARPVLGQLFFIDEKDDNDKALVRNTNNNRHRSFQSAVIHLALRAWR